MPPKISFRYDVIGPLGPIPNGIPPHLVAELLASPDHIRPPDELMMKLHLFDTGAAYSSGWGLRFLLRWCGHEPVDLPVLAPVEPGEICLYAIEPRVEPCFIIGLDRDGNPEGHSFLDFISEPALEQMRSGSLRLSINYLSEGYTAERFFLNQLQEQIQRKGIPLEQAYFFTGNAAITDSLERILGPEEKRMRVRSWPFLECFMAKNFAREAHDPAKVVGRTDVQETLGKTRERHYLSFNRMPQSHRHALVCLLLQRNLLEQGLISFPEAIDHRSVEHQGNWAPFDHIFRDHPMLPELKETSEKLKTITPLVIDCPDFRANLAGKLNAEPFLKTYFSIIGETLFYEESTFLSEKTFKAVVNFHPFILVAPTGSLRALRSLGYKTFEPFICESYDEITNPAERLLAIVDEVARLASLSHKLMAAWYRELFPVLEHNRNHFLDFQRTRAEIPAGLLEH